MTTSTVAIPTKTESRGELLGRGILGLTDQAIVSAGNFLVTLFLARRLPESTFGTFAILIQLLLVLNNLHDSLVNYPVSVRGAKVDSPGFRRLIGAGLKTTLILCVAWSVAMLIGTVATQNFNLLPWMILAMVSWQIQELFRRSLMAQGRFEAPIIGDCVSFLGRAAAVIVLVKPDSQLPLVFAIIAVSSALAAGIQFMQTRPQNVSTTELRIFASQSWDLGRWLLLNNLLGMINIQLIVWTVGYFHGLVAAALLTAASNVLGITHPALMGLTRMTLPSVARRAHEQGTQAAVHTAAWFTGLGAVIVLPVYAIIAIFPMEILRLFFNDKYHDAAFALRLLVIFYGIDYIGRMIESTLNGLERNRAASLANIASAAVSLTVTVPLVYFHSVNGAIAGGCISALARQFVGAYFLRRAYRTTH